MGYTIGQISNILLKADRTMYKIGQIAYDDMFAEDSEALDYERDIIFIYKKAVEYADDFYVGTAKLDATVERLASKISIYDYGILTPVYSDVLTNISNILIGGAALNDLTDVTISNILDNQILRYNSTLGQWVNVAPGSAIRNSQTFIATSGQSIFTTSYPFDIGLFDVYLNGVRLSADSFTTMGEYQITLVDAAITDDIIDVVIYDADTTIVNPINSLSDLDDVLIGPLSNKQALYFNSTSGKWENGAVFVPYTGAISNVNLGTFDLTADIITGNTIVKVGGLSTQYLMADGSTSTLTNPITGTGVSGQVAYWSGASTQAGSNNLFWDAATGRLGIGTNAPTRLLHINQPAGDNIGALIANLAVSAAAQASLQIQTDAGIASFNAFSTVNSNFPNSALLSSGIMTAGLYINTSTTAPIIFRTNAVDRGRFTPLGNLHLGTFVSDGGQRLQVTGDTLLKGSGNTSGTFALTVQNSDSTNILRVRNNGQIIANSGLTVGTINSGASIVPIGSAGSEGLLLQSGILPTETNVIDISLSNGQGDGTFTSGTRNLVDMFRGFAPTSGTGVYNLLRIRTTINQTGGANGVTRGLYVNPTLTAAADWRSIEWSNNTGWGLYGAGASNNYLGGRLGLNSTSLSNITFVNDLPISGSGTSYANVSAGEIQNGVTVAAYQNWTAPRTRAIAFTITNVYGYGMGNATIGAGSAITNLYGYHVANLTSATNNFGFYGDIASGTGRWNLYMNGTADNYLAGRLGIGTTVINANLHNAGTTRLDGNITQGGNPAGDVNFYMLKSLSGSVYPGGIIISSVATSSSTTGATYFLTLASTQAASFTLPTLEHFKAQQGSFGAGSTVTNQFGFRVSTSLVGATNNYGFYGEIAASANRWNFYAAGSAANYFNGNTIIGTLAADSGEKLQVNGTMRVSGASTFNDNISILRNTSSFTSQLLISNNLNGATAGVQVRFDVNTLAGLATFGKFSSTNTSVKIISSADAFWYNGTAGDIAIINDFANGSIKMAAGGSSTAQLTLNASGNLGLGVVPSAWRSTERALQIGLSGSISAISNAMKMSANVYADSSNNNIYINSSFATFYLQNLGQHQWWNAPSGTAGNAITFTQAMTLYNTGNLAVGSAVSDTGQRLQVTGDTLLKGSGAGAGTNALLIENSDGSDLIKFQNNGWIDIGNAGASASMRMFPFTTTYGVSDLSGRNLQFLSYATTQSATSGAFYFTGVNFSHTSGSQIFVNISNGFAPTSGTGTFSNITSAPAINQTGGANGITRGLYVNPTLTAAADWRSIEWSNNTGWGLYGAGTANSFLNGSLFVGSATPLTTEKFGVYGTNAGSSVFMRISNLGTTTNTSSGIAFSLNTSSGTNASSAINAIALNTSGDTTLTFVTASGGVPAERGRITNNGFIIGSTIDSGERLQVNGTMKVVTGISGITQNIASQSSGTIVFSNASTLNAVPSISCKSSDSVGLVLLSATPDVPLAGVDMILTVRETDNTDFATLTSTAFRFSRSATTLLDIRRDGAATFSSSVTASQFRLSALNTAPATSTSTGTLGEIRIDADNIYICTATNTWKRVAIATF